MKYLSRFLAAAIAATILATASTQAADAPFKVGIQTWTLRNLKFDQVVEFAKKHGITELELIPNHIDYKKESKADLEKKKAALEAAGLHAYTYGVAGTSLDKEENRKLFEFCKFMGMKLVVVEPGDFKIWDNLEELAKEYDLKVAVHNHGIKSTYGNPNTVQNIIQHRDSRIGVCLDVGWVTAAGFDAAKVFRDYKGRVYDIHLKDKRVEKTQGDDVSFDTHIGEGQTKLKELMAELKKANWSGVLAAETDSGDFAKAPDEFVSKAKAFVEANSNGTTN